MLIKELVLRGGRGDSKDKEKKEDFNKEEIKGLIIRSLIIRDLIGVYFA